MKPLDHGARAPAPAAAAVGAALVPIEAAAPVFAGHFPGQPILPGVLLLGIARRAAERWAGRPLALRRIERLRFVRPVLPPAQVSVVLTPQGHTGGCAEGERFACRWLLADGSAVARGEIVFA